jgi:hypothetical protein
VHRRRHRSRCGIRGWLRLASRRVEARQ